MIDKFLTDYPELAAVLLVLVGFALATLLASIVGRFMTWFETTIRRVSPGIKIITPTSETLIQRIIYYLTLIVFVLLSLRVLGFGGLTDFLDLVITYIPGLISGAAIIIGGYLLGVAVFQLMISSLWSGGNRVVPRLAQGAVVVVAVLTGLSQMSIDVSIIGQALMVVLVVTLGGLALAFALGSRDYVANLLARRSFKEFAVGDRVKIDELEGTIIEFTTASVLIQTEEGIAVVPAKVLNDSVVLRLTS